MQNKGPRGKKEVKMEKPKWSVVICAYGNLFYSCQAIDKILKNSPTDKIELILVDDASDDGTREYFSSLAKKHTFIKSIHHEKQKGYIISANDGMREARGDYLVLVNNDVLVTDSWLQRLTYCIEQKLPMGEYGLVGPATNFCAGRQQVPSARYDFDKLEWFAKAFADQNHGNWMETGFLSGFLLMIKRELYEEIGPFDVRFSPGGYDDNDYVLRANAKGWKAVIAGDTFVHHYGSKTFDLPEMRFAKRGVSLENIKKFSEKYSGGEEKLVVVYRIKNSERWINESLRVTTKFADEVLILDDGSTDDTVKIAKGFAKVKIKTQNKVVNEKRDREFLDNWARKEGATWIFSCDGDEVPDERMTKEYAQRLMHPANPMIKGYIFRVVTFWRGRKYIRVDSTFNNLAFCRMHKCEPNQHFECNHSQGLHCSSAPSIPIENLAWCPVRLLHYGYETFEDAKRKFDYYQKTDQDKRPELIGGEDYSHLINEDNLLTREFQKDNKLALMTMIRDEEDTLWQFLNRIYTIFDEIVFVVDSRTKDRTREIAKIYGARCVDYEFDNSFADMRNFGKSQCKSNWILQLDPDENVPLLNRLLWYTDAEKADAFIFTVKNFQLGGRVSFSESYRMFKNKPEIYYVGRVHETVEVALGKMKGDVKRSDIELHHTGYLKGDQVVEEKMKLYEKLGKMEMKDDPKNARPYFNLALHYINNGNRTKGLELLQKAKQLDPKYYLPRKELALNFLRMAKEELGVVLSILPKHHPMFLQTKELHEEVSTISEDEILVGAARQRRS